MRSARNNPNPFKADMAASCLEDWESALDPLFLRVPKSKNSTFTIQKYVKLEFKQTKLVIAYKKYNGIGETFTYLKLNANAFSQQNLAVNKLKAIGINKAKKKDLIFLFGFVRSTDRNFYLDAFEASKNVANNKLAPESDNESE